MAAEDSRGRPSSEVAAMAANPVPITCAILVLIQETRQGLEGVDGKESMLRVDQVRSELRHFVEQVLELEDSDTTMATEREHFEWDKQRWQKEREIHANLRADWEDEKTMRETIAIFLRALANVNQELLSCEGDKAPGSCAMQKLRLKQREIRDSLRAWEDELRAHEVNVGLQIDSLDLSEAKEGVEQESAKALTEGFCDLQAAAAEDCRRRSMSESAATVAESASGALRELADELKAGDDGGEEAAKACLRRLCTASVPLVSKVMRLEKRCAINEAERERMEEKRKQWKDYKDATKLLRRYWDRQRTATKE